MSIFNEMDEQVNDFYKTLAKAQRQPKHNDVVKHLEDAQAGFVRRVLETETDWIADLEFRNETTMKVPQFWNGTAVNFTTRTVTIEIRKTSFNYYFNGIQK